MNHEDKQEILMLWKQGKNTWVISQRTGASEKDVIDVVKAVQETSLPRPLITTA